MPWWERLKARRLELGLSPYALAKATNLSHPYIMKLEKGAVKEPSYAKLSLIAVALGIEVASIFVDSNRVGDGASGGEGEDEDAIVRWATEDPHIREVHQNVLAIKELSPQSFDTVKRVVAALKREAEEEARAERRAEQRSRRKLQSDRSTST
ncbi:MAG: helix-turn-helix transcriptional regulator [Chloroflexia bacterium]